MACDRGDRQLNAGKSGSGHLKRMLKGSCHKSWRKSGHVRETYRAQVSPCLHSGSEEKTCFLSVITPKYFFLYRSIDVLKKVLSDE